MLALRRPFDQLIAAGLASTLLVAGAGAYAARAGELPGSALGVLALTTLLALGGFILGALALRRGAMRGLAAIESQRAQDASTIMALQSARAQLARLAMVAQHTSNAVIITDRALRITWVNDAFLRLYGYTREQALGRQPGELLGTPKTRPESLEALRRAAEAGEGCRVEVVNRGADGREVCVDTEVQPALDHAGAVVGFVEIASDITERRAADERIATLLRENEALLGTIRTHAIVSVADADGRIIDVNDAFREITGYDRDELIGRDHSLLGSGTHPSTFWAAMRRTIAGGRPWRGEICNRAKDGSLHWVDSIVAPFIGADGRIDKYVSLSIDITASKLASEELARARRRLQNIIDGTQAGTWEHDLRTAYTRYNAAYARMLGHGDAAWDAMARDGIAGLVHTDDRAPVLEAWYAHLRGERAEFECEFRMRHKAGHWMWLLARGRVIEHDASGRPSVVAGIQLDIGARKHAERELARSRQRLANILDGTHVGTWEWNVQTGETVFNERWAAIAGYTLAELQPATLATWLALAHPEDLAASRVLMQQHFDGRAPAYEHELRMRHKDGHWVWVLARGKLFSRTPQGAPRWVAGTHMDITDRKVAEVALRASQAALDRTGRIAGVGGWALDLRTLRLQWTTQTCRLLEVPETDAPSLEEMIARHAPAERERVEALVRRCAESGESFDVELPMRTVGGRTLWARVVGEAEVGEGGAVRLVGALQDVTAQHLMAAAVQRSRELLASVIDNLPCGLIAFGPDRRVQLVNTELARLLELPDRLLQPGESAFEAIIRFNAERGDYGSTDLESTVRGIVERVRGPIVPHAFERSGPNGRMLEVRGGPLPGGGFVTTYVDISERKRLEAEHQAGADLLRAVIESLPCGLTLHDADNRIAMFNRRWCQLYELDDDFLADTPLTVDKVARLAWQRGDYGAIGWDEALAAAHRRADDARRAPHYWLRPGAGGIFLEVRSVPAPGGGFVSTYTDVTEQRRAAGEVEKARALLVGAIEVVDEGFVVYDPEDRLVLCNQKYRDLYPAVAELMVPGARFEDLIRTGAERGEYVDARGRIDDWVAERVAAHRAPGHAIVQELGTGKTLRIVERRLADGHTVGFRIDITELVQARRSAEAASQAMAHTLARLQAVYDILPVGISISDAEGHIVDCNPASERLLGISRTEHLARACDGREWTILREDGTPMPAEEFASVRALAQRRPVHDAVMQVVTPQRAVWLSVSAMPAAHEELGVVVAYVDITEQRAQQAALAEAKRLAEQASLAKSRFLANMSHEIRTPMNAVLGMLRLLRRTELSARQADYAAKTEAASRSLLRLLDDILDFSKVEAGKVVLESHPFRIDMLLRELSVILGASVGAKPVEVLFDIDPQLPRWVLGDPTRLQQVLINLGGNAIKFTPQGEVVVSVRQLHRGAGHVGLRVAVRDTGIGIAPENQARIFEGFTQAEASTTRRFGGTGLGVVICQRLVRLMGGELRLDSELGRGSTFGFEITLPLASAPADDDMRSSLKAETQLRVLVVDDNPTARDLLAKMGKSLGWNAAVADSGAQALQLLQAACDSGQPFDAVFLDWQMPGLDGWQTLHQMVARNLCPVASVVVMVTAHGREQLEQRSTEEQERLDAFLVKPVTASMLYDAIVDARRGQHRPALARPARQPGASRLSGLSVLLVEDNANNRQVACDLLADEGAVVDVACDGLEAVEMLAAAEGRYEIVLMDLQMPVMDGFAATSRIRQDLALTDLPIVAMTANALASDRAACLSAGMNEHVAKPFDLDHLVAVMLALTGREAQPCAGAGVDEVPNAVAGAAAQCGIDVVAALHRMAGNAAAYRRALERFANDSAALLAAVRRGERAGKLVDAARALHTLRGLAATLGVDALATAAERAEAPLRRGESAAEALWKAMDDAQTHWLAGLPALRSAWATDPADLDDDLPDAATLDAATLADDLRRLAALLDEADMDALAWSETLGARHRLRALAQWVPLQAAVNALDFDTARECVAAWLQELAA